MCWSTVNCRVCRYAKLLYSSVIKSYTWSVNQITNSDSVSSKYTWQYPGSLGMGTETSGEIWASRGLFIEIYWNGNMKTLTRKTRAIYFKWDIFQGNFLTSHQLSNIVIVIPSFKRTRRGRCLPLIAWERRQIQFAKRCVLIYLTNTRRWINSKNPVILSFESLFWDFWWRW